MTRFKDKTLVKLKETRIISFKNFG